MTLRNTLAKLVDIRRSRNITQADLGARVGISQAAVAKLEGQLDDPTWMQVQRLAHGLGFDLEIHMTHSNSRQVSVHLPTVTGIVQQLASRRTAERTYDPAAQSTLTIGRVNGEATATAIAGEVGSGKTVALASLTDSLVGRANLIVMDFRGEVLNYLQRMQSKALFDVHLTGDQRGILHPSGPPAEVLTCTEGAWSDSLSKAISRLEANASPELPNILMIDDTFHMTANNDCGPGIHELLAKYPILDGVVFTTHSAPGKAQRGVVFEMKNRGEHPVVFVNLHTPEAS